MGKHNERKLSLIYDKRQKDFVVKYPLRCDGSLIMHKLIGDVLEWDANKMLKHDRYSYKIFNLKDELEKRGYDLSTLKFSIELKKGK